MSLADSFPFIVSLGLFVITVVLIFVLRAKDRHDLRLTEVEKFVMDSIGKIKTTDDAFKQDISDIERNIADKEKHLTDKIQAITAQINQIASYSEDLARLRVSMNTYQDALAGIARLTTEADDKIKQIESDIEKMSEVNKLIEGFRTEVTECEQKLRDMEASVAEIVSQAINKLEDSSNKVTSDCDNLVSELDRKVESVGNITVQYIGELDEKISATQVASSMLYRDGAEAIEKLIEEKRKLETEIQLAKHSKADLDIKIATMEASVHESESDDEVFTPEPEQENVSEDVPDWDEKSIDKDEEEIVFD